MTEVRCKVESCVFWGRGSLHRCEIWVKDSLPDIERDELLYQAGFEFADDLEEEPDSVTSVQTYCETMRPR